MGNNIILETKFVADISGSFYIPSYQRGYDVLSDYIEPIVLEKEETK